MNIQGTEVRRVMSASTLKGDKVVNRRDEDLGDIKDFMIDLDSGCVSYAILSYGGVLGMGDKYFAVPMQALTLDEDRKVFILDVSKDQIKNAPGFDKNNWPDMADQEFISKMHSFYGTTSSQNKM